MKSQMCTKHVGIRLILVLVVCYYFLYNVSLPKLVLESHTSNYLKKNNKGAITNFLFSGKGMGSYEVTKDIDLMIKEIKEKFVLTRPLISSHNVSCSYKTKSVDSIEDLLCMVSSFMANSFLCIEQMSFLGRCVVGIGYVCLALLFIIHGR